MTHCIKCGFEEKLMAYRKPHLNGTNQWDAEYLYCSCARCGYTWHEPTLEQQETIGVKEEEKDTKENKVRR